jgi:hypothetical protein
MIQSSNEGGKKMTRTGKEHEEITVEPLPEEPNPADYPGPEREPEREPVEAPPERKREKVPAK